MSALTDVDAVLFNPQVVVEPGDYRDLYADFPEVRDRMAEASDVLGVDLADKFYSDDPALITTVRSSGQRPPPWRWPCST